MTDAPLHGADDAVSAYLTQHPEHASTVYPVGRFDTLPVNLQYAILLSEELIDVPEDPTPVAPVPPDLVDPLHAPTEPGA